jgi:hypothetical protein
MRYWAYLAGKVVVAAAPLYALLFLIGRAFPAPPKGEWPRLRNMDQDLLHGMWMMGWFLLAAGVLYLIVWDQRRRCRVCLRRLRMPIETGSRGFTLLLGEPRIETICTYGHGTLSEEETAVAGLNNAEWTPHSDDIWDELCAPGKDTGQEP